MNQRGKQPKKYDCYACTWCGFHVIWQRAYCEQNLVVGFPKIGQACKPFERYPGAEPAGETA